MPPAALTTARSSTPPLCVDLDGTLIATDVLWESIARLLKTRPLLLLLLPLWLLRGRAHLKAELARRVSIDPRTLPYRDDVVEFVRRERRAGRHVVLATATDARVARVIAEHLGIFAEVVASDGRTNLSGRAKRDALERRFGAGQFDYLGDRRADLTVRRGARAALTVTRDRTIRRRLEPDVPVAHQFVPGPSGLRALPAALRVHQWLKNLLVFAPVVLAHDLGDPLRAGRAALAFLAFSLLASGTYLLNDLLDLDADRAHPRKRRRPLAAGTLPIPAALVLVPLLVLAAGALAVPLGARFSVALGGYLALTTAYSFALKRVPVLDVLVLALLYTVRVLAGGVAVGVIVSPWLLALSLFLFQSLAVLKRHAELGLLDAGGDGRVAGRGYVRNDRPWLLTVGTACGYLAVLVLALYITSQDVMAAYRRPDVLWAACVLLLFWITRLWFMAQRELIEDDPIVVTLRDRGSWLIGAGIAATLLLAT